MMDGERSGCPSFEELMALIDGELSARRRAELEEHLGTCGYCRSVVDTQRRMESSWRESYRDPADSDLESMRRRVMDGAPASPRKGRLLRFGLPIAAALVAALLGLRLFVPGTGGLLGTVDTPASRAARRAEQHMEAGTGGMPAEEAAPETVDSLPAFDDEFVQEQEEAVVGAVEDPTDGSAPLAEPSAGLGMAQGGGGASTSGAASPGEAGEICAQGLDDAAVADGTAAEDAVTRSMDATVSSVATEEEGGGTDETPLAGAEAEDELQTDADLRQAGAPPAGPEPDSDRTAASASGEAGLVLEEHEAPELSDSAAVRMRDDDESGAGALAAFACATEPQVFEVRFDSAGVPSADRGALLDSIAPGWRGSLEGLYADTTLMLDAGEIASARDSE
jgi:hypothetical protein